MRGGGAPPMLLTLFWLAYFVSVGVFVGWAAWVLLWAVPRERHRRQ